MRLWSSYRILNGSTPAAQASTSGSASGRKRTFPDGVSMTPNNRYHPPNRKPIPSQTKTWQRFGRLDPRVGRGRRPQFKQKSLPQPGELQMAKPLLPGNRNSNVIIQHNIIAATEDFPKAVGYGSRDEVAVRLASLKSNILFGRPR
jgi:hypothetical protein